IGRVRHDLSASEGVEIGIVSGSDEVRIGKVKVMQGNGALTDADLVTRRWNSSWNGRIGTSFNVLHDAHSFLGLGLTIEGERPDFSNVTGTVLTIPSWAMALPV